MEKRPLSTSETSCRSLNAQKVPLCATSRRRLETEERWLELRETTPLLLDMVRMERPEFVSHPVPRVSRPHLMIRSGVADATLEVIPSRCRAVVGIVAGGGRVDKPFLKAGRKYHAMRAKRNSWPRTRGVAMNPVDHPHGGGNHQHIGHASTMARDASAGQKAGLIAARRTGLLVSNTACRRKAAEVYDEKVGPDEIARYYRKGEGRLSYGSSWMRSGNGNGLGAWLVQITYHGQPLMRCFSWITRVCEATTKMTHD